MNQKFDKLALLNWITGGCKNFCVNGHLAGNCHYFRGEEMTVSNELIDNLLADYKKPEDSTGEHSLLKQLTRKLVFTTSHGNYDTRYSHAGNMT